MQIEEDADNEGNKKIYIQAKENMIWSDSFYEVDHLPMLIPSDHPKKIFNGNYPTCFRVLHRIYTRYLAAA